MYHFFSGVYMPDFSPILAKEFSETIFLIALTLFVAIIADTILRSFIRVPKSLENRRARSYVLVLRKIVTVIVYVVAGYVICMQLGINLTPLLASASIVGIIVGIGARALIEDLINGFFLLSHDSISIGDFVKIDQAEGYVEKLGFRALTIRGEGGETTIIPNGMVKTVVNYSRHRSYMSVDFPVKSDQEIDRTVKAMEEALESLKKDHDVGDSVFAGSEVLGIEEYKVDGRMILRVRIVTTSELRLMINRKYRYLAKKNFEKYKIALA